MKLRSRVAGIPPTHKPIVAVVPRAIWELRPEWVLYFMSKIRGINTRFWSDTWVREDLNPLDRYLFLYFLTNEHANISGIYEMPLGTVAFETGLDKDDLAKSMLKRLAPKLFHFKGWVILPNFPKHQNLKSEDVVKGIKREFLAAPIEVQKEAIKRGWGDGLGIVPTSPGVLNLTKPNLNEIAKPISSTDFSLSELREVREDEEGKAKPQRKQADPRAMRLREWAYDQIAKEYGVRPTPSIGDYKQLQTALKTLNEEDIKVMMEDAFAKGEGRTVRNAFTNAKIDLYRQNNL